MERRGTKQSQGVTVGTYAREELSSNSGEDRYTGRSLRSSRGDYGEKVIERRRPMIRREDVELMGPTARCPPCHKQMMKEPFVGVSHAEECRRKHESRMARDKDPRYERAFENLMNEDEDTMRRENVNRQAVEERELKKRRRAEEMRGEGNARGQASSSSGGNVRMEDRQEQGTKKRTREVDEKGPRVANTLRREELSQDEEPVAMEDESNEDNMAEAICRIAGGAIHKDKRRRRWNE